MGSCGLLVSLNQLSRLFVCSNRGKFSIALGSYFTQPGDHTSRTRRDQASNDDILLETRQSVDPSRNCGLGEDARRLLERSGRDERVGLQARLGDSLQHRSSVGRLEAFALDLSVLQIKLGAIDLL